MKTYKVVYEDYFSEKDFDSCEITSTDKRKINYIAKSKLGLVYEVLKCGNIYLGRYDYDYNNLWGNKPSVIWKPAD